MRKIEKQRLDPQAVALRATKEFFDRAVVNLGIGIPTLCAIDVPRNIRVIFQAENGALAYGPPLTEEQRNQWDDDLIDGAAQYVSALPEISFVDSATSFGMIRGGHIDIAVLGALQVSEKGDLANWRVAGMVGGMGGAMDLAVGSKKVIVTMEHVTKTGEPRILKECTYPITARRCVRLIITDLSVIEVTQEGLGLKEIAPGWTVEEVQQLTEPKLTITSDLKEMELNLP